MKHTVPDAETDVIYQAVLPELNLRRAYGPAQIIQENGRDESVPQSADHDPCFKTSEQLALLGAGIALALTG